MQHNPSHEAQALLNEAILVPHYGLEGQVEPLEGELDENYKVTCADGRRFVLKIMRPGCDLGLVDMQVQAMDFVSQKLQTITVPAVITTRSGEKCVALDYEGTGERLCWMIEFISGDLLDDVRHQPLSLISAFGAQLGELVDVLSDFQHDSLCRPLKWSLNQADWVAGSLDEISRADYRNWVKQIAERYSDHVSNILQQLPPTNIHGDAHGQNVLASEQETGERQISGMIDFGDLHQSNAICEIAIASAYAMMNRSDPIACAEAMLKGFHAVYPVSEDAVGIYLDLILTRLAVSVTNSAIQKELNPDDPYIVVSERPAWALLQRLMNMDQAWLRHRFRWACFGSDKLTVSDSQPILEPEVQVEPVDMEVTYPGKPVGTTNWGEHEANTILATRFLEPRPATKIGVVKDSPSLHTSVELFARQAFDIRAPFDGTIVAVEKGAMPILIYRSDDSTPTYLRLSFPSGADFGSPTAGHVFDAGDRMATVETEDGITHLRLIHTAFDPTGLTSSLTAVTVDDLDAVKDLFLDPAPLLGMSCGSLNAELPVFEKALERRRQSTASNQSLSYKEPVEIVRGNRHFLFDTLGRRYIDGYNNVPHVGHSHPKVIAAAQRQMQLINTNTRYLNDRLAEYGEALKSKLPSSLEICYFVNSASEGNELALRLARTATGAKDVIVMEHSYHGHTTSLVDISPYKHNGRGGEGAPDWVHTTVQADPYRGEYKYSDPNAGVKYAEDVQRKIEDIHAKGRKLSAHICEMFPSVGGQMEYPKGYLKAVYQHVRNAGGICIADEVQTGLARLGTNFWGFETQDVVPDIVVLGKPLGNGHPIGAVITTRAIAEKFANGMEFFSTFGGNTVSCAIGKAVLDVIDEEDLQNNALKVGNYLLDGLCELQTRFDLIGDVRGRGLFIGVELVIDNETLEPAAADAGRIVDGLRDRHILIGRDGPMDNILKIRPPMTFDKAAADELLQGLEELL